MHKKSIAVVWSVAFAVAIIIVGLIWLNERTLYSADYGKPLSRTKGYGTAKYVTDIRLGWCNNDGEIIERNFFTDSLSVTVFLQNFDGWLLQQAQNEPRLVPSELKDDLDKYNSLNREKSDAKKLSQTIQLQAIESELRKIQPRVNHWMLQERSNLRLAIAGHVFETIPPFDASAPPTYGSGDYQYETYNRVVFHLAAPKNPKELEKWHEIIRAVGTECEAEISVARPVAGATDALRMPTLVNSDAVYEGGANLVRRRLPLVPPMRQAAAALASVFTIATVLSAAVGTRALRDGRGPGLADKNEAPWSLARVVFAWWITICVGCFAYLWALMGEHRNTLSKTVPILLGIQGTTMLISAGFGRTKTPHPSQGFFSDLISEAGEPEIARLQMLIWNGVLGVIFIWQSVFEWKMPEFDATLMTLLGISSSAYVGFKLLPAGNSRKARHSASHERHSA